MAFGYSTSVGWLTADYDQVVKDLRAKYLAETSVNADVENGPPADMLRTVALALTQVWRDAEGAYNAGFISAAPGTNGVAEGSSLELLLSPRIGPKLAEQPSTIVLELAAAVGPDIAVPAGSRVRLTTDTAEWTLDAPVLIPGGGTIDGAFTFTEPGPKKVIAGSSWSITTPVSGWLTAGPNALDAIPGRYAEIDAEYRHRYRESLTNDVVAEVRKVAGVTLASVTEWPNGVPDGFWGLTHWVEVMVVGGADAAIAEAIHRSRSKGVRSVGNTTVVVADADYIGGSYPESFTRPVLVSTYAEVTITPGEGYPADGSTAAKDARKAAVRQAVFAHVAALQPGQDTSGFKIASYVNANAGIPGIDLITVKIDTIDPPVNTGTLAVPIREQLTIALIDIDVIGA
jgi:uncharacterized phage protein gp47/JayE